MLPPTDEAYEAACKDRGVKPQSEILEDGTRAHWIGNPQASHIVMNFHGMSPLHAPYSFPHTRNENEMLIQDAR